MGLIHDRLDENVNSTAKHGGQCTGSYPSAVVDEELDDLNQTNFFIGVRGLLLVLPVFIMDAGNPFLNYQKDLVLRQRMH